MVESRDPLYRDVRLDYSIELPVLGIPVRFEANVPDVLAAVRSCYGAWQSVSRETHLLSPVRLRVRIVVQRDELESDPRSIVWSRLPDPDRLVIGLPGGAGVADIQRGDAVAFVTPALVADREHFSYGVLQQLTFFLVTHFDRQPVHAAALVRGNTVLLLTGPSGIGKSTVAYAALRSGLRVLTDDAVYVQLDPDLRVWWAASRIHLPMDARERFAELTHAAVVRRPNGKQTILIPLTAATAGPGLLNTDRVGLCLLARGRDRVALQPASPAAAVAYVTEHMEPGFDRFTHEIRRCVNRLAERGCWRLVLSRDPGDTLPLIERMMDELAETG